jgi:hypothetical protein
MAALSHPDTFVNCANGGGINEWIYQPGNCPLSKLLAVMPNDYQVILAPMEDIALPSTLDGSQGKNRAHESSLLPAQHDMQAIDY